MKPTVGTKRTSPDFIDKLKVYAALHVSTCVHAADFNLTPALTSYPVKSAPEHCKKFLPFQIPF